MEIKVLVIVMFFCTYFINCEINNRTLDSEANVRNNVQIVGLNAESQIAILRDLDVYELAIMVRTNKDLAPLADKVFKEKFASKSLGIFGPLTLDPRYSLHILQEIITNYNFDVFSLILRTFGHLVDKLIVGYEGIQLDQGKEIHQLIYECCATTVKSIELVESGETMLESFEIPLQHVSHLTLSGNLRTKTKSFLNILSVFRDDSLQLNEIFPNVRRVTLDNLIVSNPKVLNVHFAHLMYVKINLLQPPFDHLVDHYFTRTKSSMQKLFGSNPKIRTVILDNCNSIDYIRIVAENLPELESFQPSFTSIVEKYTGDPIHFEKLKKLVMKFDNLDLSKVVTFSNLVDLVLECNTLECDRFPFDTITSLRKLFIIGYSFKSEKILRLAEKVPFLTDLFIASESDIEAGAVIKFAVGSKNLNKLTVINQFAETILGDVSPHLQKEWSFKRNHSMFSMKKRKSKLYV